MITLLINNSGTYRFTGALLPARLAGASVLVLAAPKSPLDAHEVRHCSVASVGVLPPAKHKQRQAASPPQIETVASFVDGGGAVLVLGSEGETSTTPDGDTCSSQSAINTLTMRFGVELRTDTVLRTVYHKYFHPKEAFIAQACCSADFSAVAAELHSAVRTAARAALGNGGVISADRETSAPLVDIVYPRGCTLAVARPAVALMTSGSACYPVEEPVLAVREMRTAASTGASNDVGGRIAVLGSVEMLSDAWLGREGNAAVCTALFHWLCSGGSSSSKTKAVRWRGIAPTRAAMLEQRLANIGAPSPMTSAALHGEELSGHEGRAGDTRLLPDIGSLAERLRGCLQEPDPLPADIPALADCNVFAYSTRLVPETVALYDALSVKHEPTLALIPPHYEAPLPKLSPAVFPPIVREPPPPPLELFDLDEQFASERARLAQLANKCGPEDLDYFVRECGIVCGVMVRRCPTGISKCARR